MLNETDIVEGNKLIAEFMGVDKNNYRSKNDLHKYHESWDWLMPVVEKIENIRDDEGVYLYSVDMGKDFCFIRHNSFTKEVIACYSEYGDKIISVLQAVVQFIKWYNQNK